MKINDPSAAAYAAQAKYEAMKASYEKEEELK